MERRLIVCCGSLASPSMFQISLSWLSYCPGWDKWLPETSEINPAAVDAIITFNDMCETVQVSEGDRRKCNLLCASTKKTKGLRHRLPKKKSLQLFLVWPLLLLESVTAAHSDSGSYSISVHLWPAYLHTISITNMQRYFSCSITIFFATSLFFS